MDWRLFFKRHLKFGQKLKRYHHGNAILFLLLTITGFLLFSEAFRTGFPTIRVMVRISHIGLGILSCFPFLFYLPKMTRHLNTLKNKVFHRSTLFLVLVLLTLLISSGLVLVFHRDFPPFVSTLALFIHDFSTIVGVPYVTYHSFTRSRWFKRWATPKRKRVEKLETPHLIEEGNPILKRRSFLKLTAGTAVVLIYAPFFMRWLQVVMPTSTPSTSSPVEKGGFKPLPHPAPDSLPPKGGGRSGQFRYYTVTEIPKLNDHNFRFTINGLVDHPCTYDWNSFIQLKRSVQVSNFHCVTGWNVNQITWEGLPLHQLLTQVGVKPQAKYVKFYSADGVYTDTLTIEQARMSDVMVAVLIDGKLIEEVNGGPVRLIVPGMYGYKSVKWLSRIELLDHDQTGYWEARGYPKNAWVQKGL